MEQLWIYSDCGNGITGRTILIVCLVVEWMIMGQLWSGTERGNCSTWKKT